MTALKVFFHGYDRIGWALDRELELTQRVADFVRPSAIFRADVVHSVSWQRLIGLPKSMLHGRRLICHLTHDHLWAAEQPEFLAAKRIVNLWIVRTQAALEYFRSLQLRVEKIPYAVDGDIFRFAPSHKDERCRLRERLGLPLEGILIGSFQRDSEGFDLSRPKMVKGPDIFVQTLAAARQLSLPVHAVLAGPRRHWIRSRLRAMGIPFSFIGRDVPGDDIRSNSLPPRSIAELYRAIDLYVVSSRLEAGPQAIMECAASGCAILSTNVGSASEWLEQSCLYASPEEAAGKISALTTPSIAVKLAAANRARAEIGGEDNQRALWLEAYSLLRGIQPVGKEELESNPDFSTWIRRRMLSVLGNSW